MGMVVSFNISCFAVSHWTDDNIDVTSIAYPPMAKVSHQGNELRLPSSTERELYRERYVSCSWDGCY